MEPERPLEGCHQEATAPDTAQSPLTRVFFLRRCQQAVQECMCCVDSSLHCGMSACSYQLSSTEADARAKKELQTMQSVM